ncbi:ferritin-like domain-containing protein [Nocardia terpenica]
MGSPRWLARWWRADPTLHGSAGPYRLAAHHTRSPCAAADHRRRRGGRAGARRRDRLLAGQARRAGCAAGTGGVGPHRRRVGEGRRGGRTGSQRRADPRRRAAHRARGRVARRDRPRPRRIRRRHRAEVEHPAGAAAARARPAADGGRGARPADPVAAGGRAAVPGTVGLSRRAAGLDQRLLRHARGGAAHVSTDQQALTDALNAEYTAVFAYGVIAAYASAERNKIVAEYLAAHRARRDATIDALKSLGAPVPAPAAAYNTPFPVNDPIPAAKLAVTVESDTAATWRSVVERCDSPALRRTATDALTECAVRLATWQSILGTNPATASFPGKA